MKFDLNKSYRIVVDINGKILTYSIKVIDEDENFVSFVDKFGNHLSYNKRFIISYEEVKE